MLNTWARGERLALFGVVIAALMLIGMFVVPNVRTRLGLEARERESYPTAPASVIQPVEPVRNGAGSATRASMSAGKLANNQKKTASAPASRLDEVTNPEVSGHKATVAVDHPGEKVGRPHVDSSISELSPAPVMSGEAPTTRLGRATNSTPERAAINPETGTYVARVVRCQESSGESAWFGWSNSGTMCFETDDATFKAHFNASALVVTRGSQRWGITQMEAGDVLKVTLYADEIVKAELVRSIRE